MRALLLFRQYFSLHTFRKAAVYLKRHGLRAFLERVRERLAGVKAQYGLWIRQNEPSAEALNSQRNFPFRMAPKISVIVPVLNTPEKFLAEMIESVKGQTYPNWELCLADGGSSAGHVRRLLEEHRLADPRIRVEYLGRNLGIAGNSNAALRMASGDYVALLDHDDLLAPFAFFEVVRAINEHDAPDFLYSDEDKITQDSSLRYDWFFKPDFSPDMLLSCNYICHLTILKKGLVDATNGFREGFDGSQDYDLFLRASRAAEGIVHIPKVLYHWRAHTSSAAAGIDAKPYAIAAGKKAISDYLETAGSKARVRDASAPSFYRVDYEIDSPPACTVIIPTRDALRFLEPCVSSILAKTEYPGFRLLIVDNGSREKSTLEYFEGLRADPRIRILRCDAEFNFARLNNLAAAAADTELLLFLNNDTEVISPGWQYAMAGHALRREVGAVGAKLYYRDHTIQHGGVLLGVGGVANHAHRGAPARAAGYFNRLNIIHNVSAVTGACLMMRKEVFLEAGGFDERYSHAYNDIDLCMKLRRAGYFIVWTPYAELFHYESKSRGIDDTPEKQARFLREQEMFRDDWGEALDKGDPFYNPNLTRDREDFSLNMRGRPH